MSANNTDILVSNETNTTSSNNELKKTSSDSPRLLDVARVAEQQKEEQ